jgi:hypothetical protein
VQQLSGRDTYTPRDVPPVPGNCGLSLNREETLSVAGLKTPDNIPEAALTPREGKRGGFMLAFVLNKHGKPLMPCHPAKARILLKQGKAKVVKRTPFTIQLQYGSSGYKQPVVLGVDSGYSKVGLSAISEKRELFSAEVALRTDIVKLLSERRQYRRFRRYRKTWYRKPRFQNRKKPEGWLAPSIQNKLDTHIKVINQVSRILPVTEVKVEVAAFDIQRIKNPDISGVDYQNGVQKGFSNVREYVLYRDGHICQHCKGKTKDPVLEVHHIVSRQVGSNSPDNLITLCRTCHQKVSQGKIKLQVTPSKEFKAETFMTTVRWKLIERLRELGYKVSHTYGYITKDKRVALGIEKSHINDAFVIAGGDGQTRRSSIQYFIQQVRKCNRKLFKGDRSHIKNIADRFVKGYQRFDKVLWNGIECFIFGRRTTGYFDLRKLDGTRLNPSVSYKQISLLERAKTLLTERRIGLSSPCLKAGVSET